MQWLIPAFALEIIIYGALGLAALGLLILLGLLWKDFVNRSIW